MCSFFKESLECIEFLKYLNEDTATVSPKEKTPNAIAINGHKKLVVELINISTKKYDGTKNFLIVDNFSINSVENIVVI